MRRRKRITGSESARALLRRAPYVELATTDPEGNPVLRTLNGVLVEDWMMFHGAFAGEKSHCFGRQAVIGAYEIVADIPSHFVHEEKACPATTYFRSAQAKGILQDICDSSLKVKTLQALMDKLQPEGGFLSFANHLDFYKKDLRSTRVFGVQLEELTGKASIGQDKPPEFTEKILLKLFERGNDRDLKAIGIILEASPHARPKEWVFETRNGQRLELQLAPNEDLAKQHAVLLEGQYWRLKSSRENIEASILNSSAWVGVTTNEGRLVAAARATADRRWAADIFDVIVQHDFRKQGLGGYVMRHLLKHPLVRSCPTQRLGTKDAAEFYAQFGFKNPEEIRRDFVSLPLVRLAHEVNESFRTTQRRGP